MIHRIFHIVLAALIYVSSMGFTLNAHFCRGELKDLRAFLPARSCHAQVRKDVSAHCPMHAQAMTCNSGEKGGKNCCDDESRYLKKDQEQQFQLLARKVPPFPATVDLVRSPADLPVFDHRKIDYLNYKPPLIFCNYPVLLQTFLF